MKRIDKLLGKLSLGYAVTGQEGGVKSIVQDELESFCDRVESDRFGNIIAYRAGKGKKKKSVLIACHLDEIGFMVHNIENEYIRFSQIGGTDTRILPGQQVMILTKPPIPGIIGMIPPHYTSKEERNKVLPLDKLFVDTGMRPEEVKQKIKIGDFIGFHAEYGKLKGNYRTGKSLDNRVGVVCGVEALRMTNSHYDIYLVLTCQEEFSGLGALVTSYRIYPDFAVVIDVTHGRHPKQPEHKTFEMNKGPVIGFGPTINRTLFAEIKKVAEKNKIPYQIEPLPRNTGTDADNVAFVKQGIKTLLIEVPIKYMHSPVEVVCLKDIKQTVKLLKEYLSQKH